MPSIERQGSGEKGTGSGRPRSLTQESAAGAHALEDTEKLRFSQAEKVSEWKYDTHILNYLKAHSEGHNLSLTKGTEVPGWEGGIACRTACAVTPEKPRP